MTRNDEMRYKFYEDLYALLRTALKTDKRTFPGGLYVRVGTDHTACEGVPDPYSLDDCNNNGLFLSICVGHSILLIDNTIFPFWMWEKTTKMHHRSRRCGSPHLLVLRRSAILHFCPPHAPCRFAAATVRGLSLASAPQISVNGTQLQVVDNLPYLGSTLSRSTKIDDEVARRISKATQAFGCLQSTVWSRHDLQLSTKPKMYKAVILPTLLYGAETWTVYTKQTRRLDHLHLSCLCRILRLRWQDRIPDKDALERTGILSIYAMLRQLQLHWSGHLVRMDNEWLPKRFFYGDVATGSRRQGGQICRYKDTLKSSLKRRSPEPPLPSSSSSSCSCSCSSSSSSYDGRSGGCQAHQHRTQQETLALQPPTPEVRTKTTPALTATAPSPHTSAWSVTCESIAQRLTIQCLKHQPTPTALASTAHTALALSHIAWAYSASCASTRAESTAVSTPTISSPPTAPSPTLTPSPCPPPPSPPQPLQPTPTPPTSHAHTVHAHSPHASTWSVTCESIAQGLANQCLKHPPTPAASASNVHTAPRTFVHRMGLFGHMSIQENLR
ncbi:hypothetical protein SprV_0100381200 [Sparganum proliferum]